MPDNYFVHPDQVSAFGFDWGRLALTVGPEVNGAKTFSGGVVDLPSGQGHSRHNHPGAEEIIFVISGEGEQMVEDEAGNPIDVKDPHAARLRAIADVAGRDAGKLVDGLLGVTEIFGTDLPANPVFREVVTGHVASLFERGALATVRAAG